MTDEKFRERATALTWNEEEAANWMPLSPRTRGERLSYLEGFRACRNMARDLAVEADGRITMIRAAHQDHIDFLKLDIEEAKAAAKKMAKEST